MFERGECGYQGLFSGDMVPTFESNIAYTLRFMIDTKVRMSLEYKSLLTDFLLGRRHELDRSTGGQVHYIDR